MESMNRLANKVLLGILSLIIVVFIAYDPQFLKYLFVNGSTKGLFLPFWFGFIFMLGIYVFVYTKIKKYDRNWKIAFAIFALAVIPRLSTLFIGYGIDFPYIPDNDFAEYVKYGQNMYYGNYEAVANKVSNKFHLPTHGGMAIFFGLISHIFSPTVIGFQTANIIITSLICVAIFYLAKDYNKNVAIIASLLYAVYPSNIISTQITTNHHGATLMFLIALIFFKKYFLKMTDDDYKSLKYVFAGTVFIVISNFIHPSGIVIILSVIFTFIIIIINTIYKEGFKLNRRMKVTILAIAIVAGGSSALTEIGKSYCYNHGIIESKEGAPFLFMAVLGLNAETGGGTNSSEIEYLSNLPEDEKTKACLDIIFNERLKQPPKDLAKLIGNKVGSTWFTRDSYFGWYSRVVLQQLQDQIDENPENTTLVTQKQNFELIRFALEHVDVVFTNIIYVFTVIGFLFRLKKKDEKESDIYLLNVMVLIILGWIGVVVLSETQPRYRYQSMPEFMVFASIGIYMLCNKVLSIKNKLGDRFDNNR